MPIRGNREKPNSGFPTFPLPLEIAVRFPHSQRTATTTLSFPVAAPKESAPSKMIQSRSVVRISIPSLTVGVLC
jgi:hypothetical protein